MVRHALDKDGALLALACSSHSGEEFHVDAAREILARAGLSEADLQNTPDYPYDEVARPRGSLPACPGSPSCRTAPASTRRCSPPASPTAGTPRPTANPATHSRSPSPRRPPSWPARCRRPSPSTGAVHRSTPSPSPGWPDRSAASRQCGGLARGPRGPGDATSPSTSAGRAGRHDTRMRRVPGLIAKDGAEAVYAVGLADGRGIAVKIADGGSRLARSSSRQCSAGSVSTTRQR